MTTLSPYIVQVPSAWQVDPEVKAWVDYLHLHLQDINVTLDFGESITNITNSESFETSSTSAEYQSHRRILEQTEDLIPVTRPKEFRPTIKASDYSAIDGDFVDARSRSTITLIPSTGAQIITANGDGSKIIVKSAITIKYRNQSDTSVTIRNEGTSLHWYLFESADEQFWRAR